MDCALWIHCFFNGFFENLFFENPYSAFRLSTIQPQKIEKLAHTVLNQLVLPNIWYYLSWRRRAPIKILCKHILNFYKNLYIYNFTLFSYIKASDYSSTVMWIFANPISASKIIKKIFKKANFKKVIKLSQSLLQILT